MESFMEKNAHGAMLEAPCIFCGYNGPGFFQVDTHNVGCPWRAIGGYEERSEFLLTSLVPSMVKAYMNNTSILDTVSLEGSKVAELRRAMSHWMKVSDIIYDKATEKDLLMMIKIEKEGKNRKYIISRLHSRFNRIRTARERKEIGCK